MMRKAGFSLLCAAFVALFPLQANADIWTDDFESYPLGYLIDNDADWESKGTHSSYGFKGWTVETEAGLDKYIVYHPTPWPEDLTPSGEGYNFDSNFADFHAHKDSGTFGSLHLDLDYSIQTRGNLRVYLSSDHSNWSDITEALSLEKSDAGIKSTSADLTPFLSSAAIDNDAHLMFRAEANDTDFWVSSLHDITLSDQPLKNYYALLVGMDYPDPDERWAQDATRLADGLKRVDGWKNANYTILDTPSILDFRNAIGSIEQDIKLGDQLLFYYSGHTDDQFQDGQLLNPEPLIHFDSENSGTGKPRDSRLDEAMLLSDGFFFDDDLEDVFNTEKWNSLQKSFIFDTCLSAGYWGSANPNFPDFFWDNRDLANLQDIRLLASSGEHQTTAAAGIISYLSEFLNSHSGTLDFAAWFDYVVKSDPAHKSNVHIKEGYNYDALYSFSSSPTYFSNIPEDQDWATPSGPVVPEPSSFLLLSLGFVPWIQLVRKRRE